MPLSTSACGRFRLVTIGAVRPTLAADQARPMPTILGIISGQGVGQNWWEASEAELGTTSALGFRRRASASGRKTPGPARWSLRSSVRALLRKA